MSIANFWSTSVLIPVIAFCGGCASDSKNQKQSGEASQSSSDRDEVAKSESSSDDRSASDERPDRDRFEEAIEFTLEAQLPAAEDCYERHAAADAQGRVKVSVEVDSLGGLQKSSVDASDFADDVDSCIRGLVEEANFRPRRTGERGTVTVEYEYAFSPEDHKHDTAPFGKRMHSVFAARSEALLECYDEHLDPEKGLRQGAFEVPVSFRIVDDGSVEDSSVSADDESEGWSNAFRSCVAGIVSEFEFPSPHEKQTIETSVTIVPAKTIRERAERQFDGPNHDLENCYERNAEPDAQGELTVTFGVGDGGLATDVSVSSSDFDADVGACIRRIVENTNILDRPMLGARVFAGTKVTETFAFDPEDHRQERELTGKVVGEKLRGRRDAVQCCYEDHADGSDSGSVTVEFTVGLDGSVADVSVESKHLDDAVGACIADVVASLQFPRPLSKRTISKTYVFESSD